MHYESLFPVDPNVVEKPDFHYLDAFQPINLASIGYEVETSLPDIWVDAKSSAQNFDLEYVLPSLSTKVRCVGG